MLKRTTKLDKLNVNDDSDITTHNADSSLGFTVGASDHFDGWTL
jgi:hypothetical protein